MAAEAAAESDCKRTPKRLIFRGLSPEKNDHISNKRVKKTRRKCGRKRQEAEEYDIEEEESQIESSLPSYLEHVFGTCLCFSQEQTTIPAHDQHSNESNTNSSQVATISNSCSKPSTEECASDTPKLVNGSDISESLVDDPVEVKSASSSIELKRHDCAFPSPATADGGGYSKERCTSGLKRKQVDFCDSNRGKRRRHLLAPVKEAYRQPPDCTLLRDCMEAEKVVNLLALVVQVNMPLRVLCKKGVVAGQSVLMSSLLLADPTKTYFKLSLWRDAAVWAERIAIGDLMYLRSVRLTYWNKEVVGTTTRYSSVLNLHQPGRGKLPVKVLDNIPEHSVMDLMDWGKLHFAYMFSPKLEPTSQRNVGFHKSEDFPQITLTHFRAKVLCIISSRVVLMADHPDIKVRIHLIHPPAPQWHSELSSGQDEIWEFTFLAVTQEEFCTQSSGTYTLQTTSRTTLKRLNSTCALAVDIVRKFPSVGGGGPNRCWVTSCLSLSHMMQFKRSGIYEVSGIVSKLEFILPEGRSLPLCPSSRSGLQLRQAVYVGCEVCAAPLAKDQNGIFRQCMQCITKSPGRGYPSSAYFFRPLLVTLQDCGSATTTVPVIVSHVVSPKVVGCSAKDVVQASLSEAPVCLDWDKKADNWVVWCCIGKDENSFVEELSFTLVDVHK